MKFKKIKSDIKKEGLITDFDLVDSLSRAKAHHDKLQNLPQLLIEQTRKMIDKQRKQSKQSNL